MPLDLDPLEQRIVGVLIEKEATVPESFPLTVNSLVLGCNQKSNRDPQTDVQDYQIEGALKSLLAKGWVLELERGGSRTRRYGHQADKQLGVEKTDLALLTELLVRGPQSPTELATRAARMHPQGTPADVERRLEALAARPVPYVRCLGRRAGERAPRWTHLLGARTESEPVPTQTAAPRSSAPAAPPPRPPTLLAGSPAASQSDSLRDLVETLEQRVLDLEARLDRLEGR